MSQDQLLDESSALRDHLISLLAKGAFPHALVLASPIAAQSAALSQQLIETLMCQHPLDDWQPCRHCSSCITMANSENSELFKLEVAEDRRTISVDQIREAISFQSLTRQYAPCKVIWIPQAELMTPSAANALLKTLEEPTPESYIILGVKHPSRLLPTIRSRCQIFNLPLPSSRRYPDFLLTYLDSDPSARVSGDLMSYLIAVRDRPVLIPHYAELLATLPREDLCHRFAVISWLLLNRMSDNLYHVDALERLTPLVADRSIDRFAVERLIQALQLCQLNSSGASGINWPLLVENLLTTFNRTLVPFQRRK
jgi:hypothetical protein